MPAAIIHNFYFTADRPCYNVISALRKKHDLIYFQITHRPKCKLEMPQQIQIINSCIYKVSSKQKRRYHSRLSMMYKIHKWSTWMSLHSCTHYSPVPEGTHLSYSNYSATAQYTPIATFLVQSGIGMRLTWTDYNFSRSTSSAFQSQIVRGM